MAFELFTSNQIANIIIKDHVIRYVGVKQSSPLVVQKYREHYLPSGIIDEGKIIERDTLKLILEECVSEWGISKRQVRFTIPDSSVVIRKIVVPIDIKDDEIVGYLYSELGSTIHLPFDEPVLDIKKLSENDDKKEILLFAAPEDLANAYSALLQEVSLKPIAADISPLCMYRLFDYSDKTNLKDHILLIQFDLQTVNLSIFYQHIPIFMRHLPLETTIEDWEIQQNRAGSNAEIKWGNSERSLEGIIEEIYREIDHVLNFYQYSLMKGKESVTKILFSGDHPYSNDVFSRVIERYEIPVSTIDSIEKLPPNYYLPLGLALKEVQ
ncbi:type IV pilus biogenesis protein PilM [Litchfieldia salsa]|uniref:Type IV pilus assembly protein PilM n=1 Tax=Litchfieldia salsa TaxID=930152 RepID=A0A1H0NTW5_9BACI|nr:pilus assembly protein PilM [Litchfieldia salsa]SDO96104.1 type IV pilus assembly protein PilM [Litchfieldia salsa]